MNSHTPVAPVHLLTVCLIAKHCSLSVSLEHSLCTLQVEDPLTDSELVEQPPGDHLTVIWSVPYQAKYNCSAFEQNISSVSSNIYPITRSYKYNVIRMIIYCY